MPRYLHNLLDIVYDSKPDQASYIQVCILGRRCCETSAIVEYRVGALHARCAMTLVKCHTQNGRLEVSEHVKMALAGRKWLAQKNGHLTSHQGAQPRNNLGTTLGEKTMELKTLKSTILDGKNGISGLTGYETRYRASRECNLFWLKQVQTQAKHVDGSHMLLDFAVCPAIRQSIYSAASCPSPTVLSQPSSLSSK